MEVINILKEKETFQEKWKDQKDLTDFFGEDGEND